MNGLENKIKNAQKHMRCPYCRNELAIIFGGLFGDTYKKVKEAGIKYKTGCCFENEYYYCNECYTYFDKNLKKCR